MLELRECLSGTKQLLHSEANFMSLTLSFKGLDSVLELYRPDNLPDAIY